MYKCRHEAAIDQDIKEEQNRIIIQPKYDETPSLWSTLGLNPDFSG